MAPFHDEVEEVDEAKEAEDGCAGGDFCSVEFLPPRIFLPSRARARLIGAIVETEEYEALLEMEVDPYAGDYKDSAATTGPRRRVGKWRP